MRPAPGRGPAVERALADLGESFRLVDLVDAVTGAVAPDDPARGSGVPTRTDAIYALRTLGSRDRDNPGSPVFERVAAGPHGTTLESPRG